MPSLGSRLFPTFQTLNDSVLEAMLNSASQFYQETRASIGAPRWLSYVGVGGTGKTFLAEMLYRRCEPALAEHRTLAWGCFRFVWKGLLGRLRGGDYYLMEDIADCNLLLLDEITADHDPNGFGRDKLCELLSARVGKWTILTSNLGLDAFGKIDQRIASRLIRDRNEVRFCNTQDFAARARK